MEAILNTIKSLNINEQQRLRRRYGNWALITGASSGIGRELSILLGDAGFNLILNARNVAPLDRLAAELQSRFQIHTVVAAADMSSTAEIEQLIRITEAYQPGLVILSAGYATSGPFLNNELHAEQKMLQVNAQAVLQLTHHFARLYSKAGGGGIVLLSSVVAFQGTPFAANYAASKAYVQHLAEALAYELKPYNVDVLAAAPGPVNSGFAARARMHMGMALQPHQVGIPILKALGRKGTVYPGFLSQLLIRGLGFLPRALKVRVMAQVMKGMTETARNH